MGAANEYVDPIQEKYKHLPDTIVKKWLSVEGIEKLKRIAMDNTFKNIALNLGVSESCLISWRTRFPEIRDAVENNKEIVDFNVESALLKRALGYKYREVKIITLPPDQEGNIQVRREVTEKEIAPETLACISWLNNRQPEKWKRNRDNFMTLTDDASNITVNVIKKYDDKSNKDAAESTKSKKDKNGSDDEWAELEAEYGEDSSEW